MLLANRNKWFLIAIFCSGPILSSSCFFFLNYYLFRGRILSLVVWTFVFFRRCSCRVQFRCNARVSHYFLLVSIFNSFIGSNTYILSTVFVYISFLLFCHHRSHIKLLFLPKWTSHPIFVKKYIIFTILCAFVFRSIFYSRFSLSTCSYRCFICHREQMEL